MHECYECVQMCVSNSKQSFVFPEAERHWGLILCHEWALHTNYSHLCVSLYACVCVCEA